MAFETGFHGERDFVSKHLLLSNHAGAFAIHMPGRAEQQTGVISNHAVSFATYTPRRYGPSVGVNATPLGIAGTVIDPEIVGTPPGGTAITVTAPG